MKKNNPEGLEILRMIARMTICLYLFSGLSSCAKLAYPLTDYYHDADHRTWVNWNVAFKPTSTTVQRDSTMQAVRDSLVRFVAVWDSLNNRTDSVDIDTASCPCDQFIYNITATIPVAASGLAATTPTRPTGPGGAGDPVEFISLNSILKDTASGIVFDKPAVPIGEFKVDNSKTLAVMDTGLDPEWFDKNVRNLVWTDPTGNPTLRNFLFYLNGKPLDYYNDDARAKHGSAVTSIALEALRQYNLKNDFMPRIMVLKVLDSVGMGSSFSVSCALSYAIQKKATLVNASLGSYKSGETDQLLQKYITRSNSETPGLPVIAAAGNLDTKHQPALFCDPVGSGTDNKLTDSRLFYPGCFSEKFNNVICVTGLRSSTEVCHYQNYSPVYVNLGVVTNENTGMCCIFSASMFNRGRSFYEGSSFATPFASGQLMSVMITNPGISLENAIIRIAGPGAGTVTKKVLNYNSAP